jgi:hypothetical protein
MGDDEFWKKKCLEKKLLFVDVFVDKHLWSDAFPKWTPHVVVSNMCLF